MPGAPEEAPKRTLNDSEEAEAAQKGSKDMKIDDNDHEKRLKEGLENDLKRLRRGSVMAERFCFVASYLQQAVDTLGTVWRGAVSGYVNKMRALADCIEALHLAAT